MFGLFLNTPHILSLTGCFLLLITSNLSFFSYVFRTFFLPFSNSSVGIVTRLWAREPSNENSIAGRDRRFSLIQNMQTKGGTRPAFCSVGEAT